MPGDRAPRRTFRRVGACRRDASGRVPVLAAIRHIGFEYAAESDKASAGFSSLKGKNNWNYQQWKGPVHDDLHFRESIGLFSNYWTGEGICRIGPDYQIPDAGAVVRAWVALPMRVRFASRAGWPSIRRAMAPGPASKGIGESCGPSGS